MVNKGELMKKSGLVGAGCGVAMFAVFGLFQGALIGGAAGLAVARYIFGETTLQIMANELLPRVVVAASMLAGVLASCAFFVVTGAAAGVAGGWLLSLLHAPAEGALSARAVAVSEEE